MLKHKISWFLMSSAQDCSNVYLGLTLFSSRSQSHAFASHILTVSNYQVCLNDEPSLTFNPCYSDELARTSWPSCLPYQINAKKCYTEVHVHT